MTQEEIERTIEFVLQQHVQFTTDIMRIKGLQEQCTIDIQQLTKDMRELRQAETTLMKAMTTALALHGQTSERVSKLENERVARLETALAELAERVSAFITALRNGRPGTS